jgi:hypothetical protein
VVLLAELECWVEDAKVRVAKWFLAMRLLLSGLWGNTSVNYT